MSIAQFLIMAVVAVLVSALTIRLVPRARQSPVFDRVLWVATWLLAFLGAWSAPSYIATDSPLSSLVIAQVSVFPTLIGAGVGALSINLLLWLMDRFSQPSVEPSAETEDLNPSEERDEGKSSSFD